MSAALDLDVRAATELLSAQGYRCLAPFGSRGVYGDGDAGDAPLTGLYLDCETTSLDTAKAEIIEFAAARFLFRRDGQIVAIGNSMCAFEQPSEPITPDITALTGITNEQVAGQRIHELDVADMIAGADLVLSHHASYDRPIVERRFPVFAKAVWGCSYVDVAWKQHGYPCAKLAHLLIEACGEHSTGAHRALEDVLIGIHVLATAQLDGRPAFAHLLDAVRRPTARLYATQSPFALKDTLKSRGYSSEYDNGRFYAWYRDLPKDDVEAEREWLVSQGCVTKVRAVSRRDLFTSRVGR